MSEKKRNRKNHPVTKDDKRWLSQPTALAGNNGEVIAGEALAVMLRLLQDIYTFGGNYNSEHFLIALRQAAEGKEVNLPATVSPKIFDSYFDELGQMDPVLRAVILAGTNWSQEYGREVMVLKSPFHDPEIDAKYQENRRKSLIQMGLGAEFIPDSDRGFDSIGLEKAKAQDFESGRALNLKTGEKVPAETAKSILFKLDYSINASFRKELSRDEHLVNVWKLANGLDIPTSKLRRFIQRNYVDQDGDEITIDPTVCAVVKAALRWDRNGNAVIIKPFDEAGIEEYLPMRNTSPMIGTPCFTDNDGSLQPSPPLPKQFGHGNESRGR